MMRLLSCLEISLLNYSEKVEVKRIRFKKFIGLFINQCVFHFECIIDVRILKINHRGVRKPLKTGRNRKAIRVG